MKRLTAGLLTLMLLFLLSGCGKKEQWSVDNFFLSDDGTTYSVSYRHDDGTQELIAEMGSYPQPLTIVSGKLYFVRGGSMVAVDLKDPTQRQTITEPGLSGLSIGWIDQEAVYCPLTTDTEKCYRVALDLSSSSRMTIPREHRPTDYDALLDRIYAAVGAIDNRIALRTLRARYSETGSPDLPGDDGLVPPGGDVFSEQLGRCTCIRPAQRQQLHRFRPGPAPAPAHGFRHRGGYAVGAAVGGDYAGHGPGGLVGRSAHRPAPVL